MKIKYSYSNFVKYVAVDKWINIEYEIICMSCRQNIHWIRERV